MYLDIEERTICANLEKIFKEAKFKRKEKVAIRENIINFIKSKANEVGENSKDKSPIQMMEDMMEYLSEHFYFSFEGDISFNKITGIKDSFLKDYKDQILAVINPAYYTVEDTAACLKTPAKVKLSQDFVKMMAIGGLRGAIGPTEVRQGSDYVFKMSYEIFSERTKGLFFNEIPEEYHEYFSKKEVMNLLSYKLMNAAQGIFNSKKFYGSNGRLRENAEVRGMKDNVELIFNTITENIILENLDAEFDESLEKEYRYYGSRPSLRDIKNEKAYEILNFLLMNLNLKEAYRRSRLN